MDELSHDEIAAYRSRRLLLGENGHTIDRRVPGSSWTGEDRRQPGRDRRQGSQRRAHDRHLMDVIVALECDLAAKNVLLEALRGEIPDSQTEPADK